MIYVNNAMSKMFLALLVITMMGISSCGDDEDALAMKCENQTLSGSINGNSFQIGGGQADIFDTDISFNFLNSTVDIGDDVCAAFNNGDVRVFFSADNEVKRTELFVDFNAGQGQTITLFDPVGSFNIIATDGYIEITSITDSLVIGHLFADGGDGDEICGSFTAKICN